MDTTFTLTCARWIHPAAIGFWWRSRLLRPNGLQSGTAFLVPARADRVPYARGKLRLKLPRPGVVAQLGERRVRNAKVGSSILLNSTTVSVDLTYCGPSPHLIDACPHRSNS